MNQIATDSQSVASQQAAQLWVVVGLQPDSLAYDAIARILNTAKLRPGDVDGLLYSDFCEAQSLCEALAEFAKHGNCERFLRLRLIVTQTLGGRSDGDL